MSAFLLRPMALGESFTILSIAFMLVALVCFFINNQTILLNTVSIRNLAIGIYTIFIWIYLVIQSICFGANKPHYLFSALVTFTSVMLVYSLILSDRDINLKFFVFIRTVIIFFILSYFTTLIVSFIIPLDHMHLFDIKTSSTVDYSDKWGGVYFPLTPAYGITKILGMPFFRSPGPFREAGIFQAFIVWAYFSIRGSGKREFCLRTVLILGLFASYSTAGIVIFGLTSTVSILFNISSAVKLKVIFKEILAILMVISSLLFIFLYMPIFGLIDKLGKAQASVSDRVEATYNGLLLLVNNPLGIGYFNSNDPRIGVNFISATGLIGIPGLILFLFLVILSIFLLHNKKQRKQYVILMMPFFLTALFSQPFIDAPFVYVMLLQSINGDS
ncbi:MAG: hypothetical protein GJV46_07140 [Geobacter sp.]|nr:hypothetical protein [Geobacter sp.]